MGAAALGFGADGFEVSEVRVAYRPISCVIAVGEALECPFLLVRRERPHRFVLHVAARVFERVPEEVVEPAVLGLPIPFEIEEDVEVRWHRQRRQAVLRFDGKGRRPRSSSSSGRTASSCSEVQAEGALMFDSRLNLPIGQRVSQLVNPWQRSSQVIASIDYAKQPDVRERVWQQKWDIVIVDEAHKCSARPRDGKSRELTEHALSVLRL